MDAHDDPHRPPAGVLRSCPRAGAGRHPGQRASSGGSPCPPGRVPCPERSRHPFGRPVGVGALRGDRRAAGIRPVRCRARPAASRGRDGHPDGYGLCASRLAPRRGRGQECRSPGCRRGGRSRRPGRRPCGRAGACRRGGGCPPGNCRPAPPPQLVRPAGLELGLDTVRR